MVERYIQAASGRSFRCACGREIDAKPIIDVCGKTTISVGNCDCRRGFYSRCFLAPDISFLCTQNPFGSPFASNHSLGSKGSAQKRKESSASATSVSSASSTGDEKKDSSERENEVLGNFGMQIDAEMAAERKTLSFPNTGEDKDASSSSSSFGNGASGLNGSVSETPLTGGASISDGPKIKRRKSDQLPDASSDPQVHVLVLKSTPPLNPFTHTYTRAPHVPSLLLVF